MCRTLARCPARRNSHRPSPSRTPPPHPVPEVLRPVGAPHPGGETRRPTLPLDPYPPDRHSRQGVEALGVEGRAPTGEDDHQRFVIHDPGRYYTRGVRHHPANAPRTEFPRRAWGVRVSVSICALWSLPESSTYT